MRVVKIEANITPMGLGSTIKVDGVVMSNVSEIRVSALAGEVTQVSLTLINVAVDIQAEIDGPQLLLSYPKIRIEPSLTEEA